MNFGVLGAGNIAHAMCHTLTKVEGAVCYAIASRNEEKANQYKEQYGFSKAYGTYQELIEDSEVEVVYIATPHSFHYEQARMCLEHNKNVLCEKPFTANSAQMEELLSLASEKGLFIGEAMWTRFMPLAKKLEEIVQSKMVGDVQMMTANLSFPMLNKERLIKPELAGGALLDVGIYPLTIASIVMGHDVKDINVSAVLTEQGVDKLSQFSLIYNNGTIADLNCGMSCFGDGKAVIYCSGGFIVVEGVNNINRILVFGDSWNLINTFERDEQITGYEYEVIECINVISKGKKEFDSMPHDTLKWMMNTLDKIREKMGVIYPFENN